MFSIEDITKRHKEANILICGNGPTAHVDTSKYWGELENSYTWTVNGGHQLHPESTLEFMMDDWLSPAHEEENSNSTREVKEVFLKTVEIPILTPKAYEEFDCFVEYPLVDVIKKIGYPYFGETISYAIAFAILCDVKRIDMLGTDYMGCKPAERASSEFWVGVAKEKGIDVHSHPDSHFLKPEVDNINIHIPYFYGFLPESFPFNYHTDENKRIHLTEKPRD